MDARHWLQPYADIADLCRQARQLLGVEDGADRSEIRTAFYRLAREGHPDVGGDPARFVPVVNAYLVLTCPDPRGFSLDHAEPPGRRGTSPDAETYLEWWRFHFF